MNTRRRTIAHAAAWLSLLVAPVASAQFRPIDYTITLTQLTMQVAKRFPYTQQVAGDLVQLQLSNPRLKLLPDANRVATNLDLKLVAQVLGAGTVGALGIDYGLRYEPADRTIRMTNAKVRSVRLDGVPAQYQSWLDRNAPRLAENLLEGYVLHQVGERELAMVAAMGYEPGSFKVTADGLKVTMNPKQP
ncbi:MAG: DUF1439 domain-containing protein [Burkholderiales bacterium]